MLKNVKVFLEIVVRKIDRCISATEYLHYSHYDGHVRAGSHLPEEDGAQLLELSNFMRPVCVQYLIAELGQGSLKQQLKINKCES